MKKPLIFTDGQKEYIAKVAKKFSTKKELCLHITKHFNLDYSHNYMNNAINEQVIPYFDDENFSHFVKRRKYIKDTKRKEEVNKAFEEAKSKSLTTKAEGEKSVYQEAEKEIETQENEQAFLIRALERKVKTLEKENLALNNLLDKAIDEKSEAIYDVRKKLTNMLGNLSINLNGAISEIAKNL